MGKGLLSRKLKSLQKMSCLFTLGIAIILPLFGNWICMTFIRLAKKIIKMLSKIWCLKKAPSKNFTYLDISWKTFKERIIKKINKIQKNQALLKKPSISDSLRLKESKNKLNALLMFKKIVFIKLLKFQQSLRKKYYI